MAIDIVDGVLQEDSKKSVSPTGMQTIAFRFFRASLEL